MSRFADPTRCPSCGTPLAPGSALCGACGVDLSGPLGRELFATLVHADSLVTRLRAAVRQPVAAGSAPAPSTASLPPAPPTAPPPPRDVLRPSRAPQLLLGLGAVCVVVAALVFLAVTWSRLGVGGRTAVLVLLTAAAGAMSAWSLRRGLRGTAEALGSVAAGLFVLDLVGARSSGWLGSPGDAAFVAVIGALLVPLGLLASLAAARTATRRLTVGEAAAALGAALLSGGIAALSSGTAELRLLVAVLVAGAVTGVAWVLHRRTPLLVALVGAACVTVLTWLALVLAGLDHLGVTPSIGSVVGDADGWPLVAAALLAVGVAALRPLPLAGRVVAGGAAFLVATLAVVAPVLDEPETPATVVAVLVVLVGVALLVAVPRPWGAVGLGAAGLAAVVVGAQAALLAMLVGITAVDAATPVWGGSADGRLPVAGGEAIADAWLLPVALTALAVAGVALVSWLGAEVGRRSGTTVVGGALAVGALGTLVLTDLPVAVPLAVLLVLVAGGAVGALVGPDRLRGAAVATGAVAAIAAAPFALHHEVLSLAALVVTVAAAAALDLRHRTLEVAVVAGALVPLLGAALVWTAGAVAGLRGGPVALVGLLVTAAVVLGRPYVQAAARPSSPPVVAVELATVVAMTGLIGAGLDVEQGSPDWLAGYLTAAGVTASLVALLRSDRRRVGWLGGLLLVSATWVRLADAGVDVVEAYTLPSAVALLVVGAVAMRRERELSTFRALGAGLGLALVPSLLVVLEEPVSLRALLLGLGCLALVVTGATRRWAAPLTFGAAVGLALVLREAGPYLGTGVPRWALIGGAGAVLIALGMTWEQRLRDARAVAGYVRGLR